MSGHSKWSTIKRKKAVIDAKRGKIFTRLLREIQIAAKIGGGNLEGNPRLKTAVATAKSQRIPNDNIDRAIKRGTGEVEGVDYEEVMYEGYGPGGVALLIKTLTDNRVRTVSDVRNVLSQYNGSLAGTNAVAYQFNDRGFITLPKAAISEEELFNTALEAGAEDISDSGEVWEITTDPKKFQQVRAALEGLGKEVDGEVRPVPAAMVLVKGKEAESLLKLLDELDEMDDVQSVVSNFDMDEKDLQSLR